MHIYIYIYICIHRFPPNTLRLLIFLHIIFQYRNLFAGRCTFFENPTAVRAGPPHAVFVRKEICCLYWDLSVNRTAELLSTRIIRSSTADATRKYDTPGRNKRFTNEVIMLPTTIGGSSGSCCAQRRFFGSVYSHLLHGSPAQ